MLVYHHDQPTPRSPFCFVAAVAESERKHSRRPVMARRRRRWRENIQGRVASHLETALSEDASPAYATAWGRSELFQPDRWSTCNLWSIR